MNRELKINLSLTLRELMDVIESLPEGHSLLPVLFYKRETLMAARRIQKLTTRMNRKD